MTNKMFFMLAGWAFNILAFTMTTNPNSLLIAIVAFLIAGGCFTASLLSKE